LAKEAAPLARPAHAKKAPAGGSGRTPESAFQFWPGHVCTRKPLWWLQLATHGSPSLSVSAATAAVAPQPAAVSTPSPLSVARASPPPWPAALWRNRSA